MNPTGQFRRLSLNDPDNGSQLVNVRWPLLRPPLRRRRAGSSAIRFPSRPSMQHWLPPSCRSPWRIRHLGSVQSNGPLTTHSGGSALVFAVDTTNTQYTVKSVDSASQVTLTKNYTGTASTSTGNGDRVGSDGCIHGTVQRDKPDDGTGFPTHYRHGVCARHSNPADRRRSRIAVAKTLNAALASSCPALRSYAPLPDGRWAGDSCECDFAAVPRRHHHVQFAPRRRATAWHFFKLRPPTSTLPTMARTAMERSTCGDRISPALRPAQTAPACPGHRTSLGPQSHHRHLCARQRGYLQPAQHSRATRALPGNSSAHDPNVDYNASIAQPSHCATPSWLCCWSMLHPK